MTEIELHFDGGCCPNPGRGYGSYEVVSPELNHRELRQQFEGHLTNNMAEYLSLIYGLRWLSMHADPETSSLKILTDSNLVCQQMQCRWKIKALHLRELQSLAVALLEPYFEWQINWVPRHDNVARFGH